MELRNQISHSGVQVDVDAPKGQDLSQIMEDVRTNYEKIAVKNAEDLKRWHENQVLQSYKKKGLSRMNTPLNYLDVQSQHLFFVRLQMYRSKYHRTQKLYRGRRWKRVTYPDKYRPWKLNLLPNRA